MQEPNGRMKACIVTLGCPKNLVDSEGMGSILLDQGYQLVGDPIDAKVIIVNTCGFVKAARDEALETIHRLVRRKRPEQRIVVTGCLVDIQATTLRTLPGVDGILRSREWPQIGKLLAAMHHEEVHRDGSQRDHDGQQHTQPEELEIHNGTDGRIASFPRRRLQVGSAYLKISDGCDLRCAFCLIPKIKGAMRSKPREVIVREAQELVALGVRELVLVAQHLTDYGRDLGYREGLVSLLDALCTALPRTIWIRLMYAHPSGITPNLIETMARHQQICAYLDLPLQHAHPETLRRMHRFSDVATVVEIITQLRAAMPDISLRSSFIVGFPGETNTEFAVLLDFLEAMRFDHVGIFRYSREPGTFAATLTPVPSEVVERRWHRAMQLQQTIALERNQRWVGRYLDVLVEGTGKSKLSRGHRVFLVGRSFRDAPEVDGQVRAWGRAEVGTIVRVKITHATPYDLWGVLDP